MEPSRFDDLARVLSAAGERRTLLRALLGAVLGSTAADTAARKRGNGKDKDRDKGRGRDQDRTRDNDRESAQRVQTERRRKGRKHKKKRRGGRNDDGGQNPEPPSGCCGTKQCPPPERGSTRSQCDFAGRFFVDRDFNGSTFRGIDGRGIDFTATDNHGSIFAEACLQGASFRSARLDGSTWGDACLFRADFTGADFGGDLTLFDNARFCHTVMPDGSINNRDCGTADACCDLTPGPGAPCRSTPDCGEQTCRTKACVNDTCVYTAVADGPSPNDLCDTHCCEGVCCPAGGTECNPQGQCCVPNCAGQDCGPDGCGGTCGSCPDGTACFEGTCICNPGTCDGCCTDLNTICRPGTTPQACGSDGAPCVNCGGQEVCRNGQCCAPACAGRNCGPDGCGGNCGQCAQGQRCQNGQCVCDAQSCPDGCCDANDACQSGSANQACGHDGAACQTCGEGTLCLGHQCGGCPTLTCQELDFACGAQSNRCGGTLQCGRCPLGATPSCQDGECRACSDVCPANCNFCVQLLDGSTRCGASLDTGCDFPCSSNADCDGEYPICTVSYAVRNTGETGSLPAECRIPQSPGVCSAIGPCCTPDCTGKTCGPDGCNGSCGMCGLCEVCENGACRPLQPNGLACTQDSECCSDNCFGGVCADLETQCINGPCNPPAKGCVAGFCCSCASPDDCCAGQCCGSDQFCCNQETCCFNAEVCNGGECIG